MKAFFRKIHLWLSIPFGVIISVVCFSGAALVYEKEIRAIIHPSLYEVEKITPERQLPSVLINNIKKQVPDSLVISSLQYSGSPEKTCAVTFSNVKGKIWYVDPYSGDVKGWQDDRNGFFPVMKKLHRWLMDDYKRGSDKLSIGKMTVGVSVLFLVVILVSGIVIWIPHTKKGLTNAFTICCTRGWRRFWYDSHRTTGIYAALLLLIMSLTGLTWSFGWYRNAFYCVFGAFENKTKKEHVIGHGDKKRVGHERHEEDFLLWDRTFGELEHHYQVYNYIKITHDKVSVAPDVNSRIRKTDEVEIDRETGKILRIIPYKDQSKTSKMKGWIYAIHTGLWGGPIIRFFSFCAALIGGILPLTGYYLWLKKRRR